MPASCARCGGCKAKVQGVIVHLVPICSIDAAEQVVVMTFCKGFKVTDAKALDAAKLDREAIMRTVTQSFAYQV